MVLQSNLDLEKMLHASARFDGPRIFVSFSKALFGTAFSCAIQLQYLQLAHIFTFFFFFIVFFL